VGHAPDDGAIGAGLGGHLHAGVGLALVVEHEKLVLVLRLGVRVAQLDRQVGGIAAAEADGGVAAGERADERNADGLLGARGEGKRGDQRCGRESHFAPPGQRDGRVKLSKTRRRDIAGPKVYKSRHPKPGGRV